jgi:intracellular multiplication protein IcmC
MASSTCTGGVSCWLQNQADILSNIVNSLAPIERLVTGAAYLIGLGLIFKAIYVLKIYGEARTMQSSSSSIKEPIVYLFVGAIFLYFPTGIRFVMQTTFGYDNPLQYAPVNSNNGTLGSMLGSGSGMGESLTKIIQVIGLFAFIRGWIMIARSASQGQPPGGTGKGLIHVFGGILAVNIVETINIINNTLFGTS